MLDGLFGRPEFLRLGLDGLSARGDAITENLANSDTPNYKRKEVEFETQLQQIRQSGESGHMWLRTDDPRQISLGPSSAADFQPEVWRATGTSLRNDGNNVDIDSEMSSLAQNEISYNAVAELMKRDFDQIKSVIKGA